MFIEWWYCVRLRKSTFRQPNPRHLHPLHCVRDFTPAKVCTSIFCGQRPGQTYTLKLIGLVLSSCPRHVVSQIMSGNSTGWSNAELVTGVLSDSFSGPPPPSGNGRRRRSRPRASRIQVWRVTPSRSLCTGRLSLRHQFRETSTRHETEGTWALGLGGSTGRLDT